MRKKNNKKRDNIIAFILMIVMILSIFLIPELGRYHRWQQAYESEMTSDYFDGFWEFFRESTEDY